MAQITEDYVSFEIAKLLKEKGFTLPVKNYYSLYTEDAKHNLQKKYGAKKNWNSFALAVSRPSQSLVMKWLREEKNVQIEIAIVGTDTWESPTKWLYGFRCQTKDIIDRRNADFSSYEEACEAAIKHCLENLI